MVKVPLFHSLVRLAMAFSSAAVLLHALQIDPQCGSPLTDMTAIGGAPGGTNTTFCVSDYGWSNGWFATGFPGDYPSNASSNLLGDNAQSVTYTLSGASYTSWLTPMAEGRRTGSDFTVITPVSKVNNDQTTSVITDGRIDIVIDSSVVANNIQQTFTITNETTQTLTNLRFVDYFNYFPYGASNPNLGTLSYSPIPTLQNTYVYGLWASGNYGDAGFIRDGGVCGGVGTSGCTTPTEHEVGTPSSVFFDVNIGAPLDGSNAAQNNAAGALAWDVNNLNLGTGASQDFTVELVPEPETVALLLIGLAGIYVGRRKF